jgi:predicted signal transduction protein with EAL and GGDEF domain
VAERIAERVAEELRAPFDLDGHEVFVTPSLGIAVAAAGDSADDLLRRADVALYAAKHTGKARFALFEEGMDAGPGRAGSGGGDGRRAPRRGKLSRKFIRVMSPVGP